jgi:hypothetical protein
MEEQLKGDSREQFLRALSNYSECIKPYLRTAQERYIANYYVIENQKFDFKSYCKFERQEATKRSQAFKASLGQSE